MPDSKNKEILTSEQKALTLNLDNAKYGTIAEIGAGQETARIFFQAGGAAGTIAKTMSAYDMTFSDKIYGKSGRYVSRERVETMLDHEYTLLDERLHEKRTSKTFFAFANTVKTKSYRGPNDAHGWLSIRFQLTPESPPNDIIIHARMWDTENVQQQYALGILGTNLIYGAFYHANNPEKLILSLTDNVGSDRVEVDLIHFNGPDFENVNNRIMNLKLVRHGLTNAVLFSPNGNVEHASKVLYKKAILVERGSFRPVSKVNIDMLRCARSQFLQEPRLQDKEVIVLAEITMNNLLRAGEIDHRDFLDRVDTLGATGNYVLISNYFEFYRLSSYFRRYTQEMVGVAMGISNLLEVFNTKYYSHLAGGILENFGRLFLDAVKLYIYPIKQKAYAQYLKPSKQKENLEDSNSADHSSGDIPIITCNNLQVDDSLKHLYEHLLQNGLIEHIKDIDESLLQIFSKDALECITNGNPIWEEMVPPEAVAKIKQNKLFGYQAS